MRGEPGARAGRQKPVKRREPLSGERARGPQLKVKPAASTYLQPGGRAAHFTAKATLDTGVSKPVDGSGGVWGAARVRGEARNTGEPSAQPESGRGGLYKPKAKSSAVQRQSEGIEVPQTLVRAGETNAVTNNAAGGKGPCGDRAGGAGKREGMGGKTDPNDPGGLGEHRSREVSQARGSARLRPADAQAAEAVARGRGDGRGHRDPNGGWHAARRGDYSPNAKGNFQFDRLIDGWRNIPLLDFRRKR